MSDLWVCGCHMIEQMELRRVQKKNKATEEMLAGDLADQCHEDLLREDSLQYSTTGDR